MSSAIRKHMEKRKKSSASMPQSSPPDSRLVMSTSEPGTPKGKGTKGPAPPPPPSSSSLDSSNPSVSTANTVIMRTNGSGSQDAASSKGHGRSVSAGAYSLNQRVSSGGGGNKGDRKSAGFSRNKKDMITRQDASESEDSDGDSQESDDSKPSTLATVAAPSGKGGKNKAGGQEWEILEGLRDGQTCTDKPDKYEGYMMKRRKWPLKGWHKRYFVLENGILTYAKSPSDILKGKYHGTVDIGLSFVTYKSKHRRIDIDAEDLIYHIKVKSQRQMFEEWIKRMRHHRLYRQNEFSFGSKDVPKLAEVTDVTDVPTPEEFATPVTSPVSPVPFSEGLSSRGSIKMRSMDRSQTKVMAWLLDAQGMEQCNKDLQATQAKIFELGGLLEKLNEVPSLYSAYSSENVLEVPNMDRPLHPSSSNPNLFTQHHQAAGGGGGGGAGAMSAGVVGAEPVLRPLSLHDGGSAHHNQIQDMKLRDDFVTIAKSVHDTLRSLTRTMGTERERFKRALEVEQVPGSSQAAIHSLKTTLAEVMKQNEDYRQRLSRIHADSSISPAQQTSAAATAIAATSRGPTPTPHDKLMEKVTQSGESPLVAASGSWESQSAQEFYDAAEYIVSTDSSEGSEEEDEEVSSEISDTENMMASAADYCTEAWKEIGDDNGGHQVGILNTGRRSKLPCPKPDVDISLWSLLCKNIGKDLSKISMPVTLNEPISMLQRLCEELEYTELVDKAADIDDPFERMVYMAAFTVSPYASTYYRAGQKPFNPMLGETYECLREDKGWRFIAEQTSHHPPVSACYCESKNFIFWQDIQIKTKFWGKSMEIQPKGTVNLKLPKYKDHYTWNKATTCVHNLLGGQRWVDHYGEVVIRNHSQGIKCKLTYAKSSYWSDKRHEVYGTITNSDGKVVHHLFGKWNEGIYYGHAPSAKCVWRPGSMPEEFDLYYGFTRFAMELNEVQADQAHLYAPTDTRYRPDQRLLEEGKIAEAEAMKVHVEQVQRDQRRKREEEKTTYTPKWFMRVEEGGQESYMYTGKYWEMRKDPAFSNLTFPKLW